MAILISFFTFLVFPVFAEVTITGNTPGASEGNPSYSYRDFPCTKDEFFDYTKDKRQNQPEFCRQITTSGYRNFLTELEETTNVDDFMRNLETLRKYHACGSDRAGYSKTQHIWTQWTDQYVICQLKRIRSANPSMTAVEIDNVNKKAMEIQCLWNVGHSPKDQILKAIEDPNNVMCGEQLVSSKIAD